RVARRQVPFPRGRGTMGGNGNLRFEFRVLGPFQVVSGGRAVEIGSAKQQALLALLVTNLNRPVSVDAIGDALWEGSPPASLVSTVQSLVYRLRKVLGEADAEAAGVAIRGRGSGYVLEGEPLQVDGHRFERLAARGRELAATGAADAAARAFRDGLALWRGPALAGLADLGFARVEATRLDQARLGAVEGLAEAELARCRHRGRMRRNCASAGTVEVAPEAQFAGTRRSSPPGQVPL
ncbi:MAG: AfsR/SARP family transcriptional regulator, partial [Acidimicrobiia bacterium]